jgi:predicted alpha/beta-fold hydrolase
VRRQSSFLAAAGFQVFRLNHRNVGTGRGKAKGFYHGDRSQDVLEAFEVLASSNPGKWIVIGQSLSGNMVLKLAGQGDAAERLRQQGCAGLIGISPVVDLKASSAAMGKSLNGFIDRVFIKRVQRYLKTNSHVASVEHIRAGLECRTLAEFDERFVAPALGINHVGEYYDRASAAAQLSSIFLPTQVFIACDDPIAVGTVDTLRRAASSHLSVKETARGGHLAFLGTSGASLTPQFLIDGWVADTLTNWSCSHTLAI